MRVLLLADMEGVSWLTDHRAIWPAFPEYWRTGRRSMTADVAAAVLGLFDGGASAVDVLDVHGSGRPNVVAESLPERATLVTGGVRAVPYAEYDATFQVGFHAYCGTPDGFLSHTMVDRLAFALDGLIVAEAHIFALASGLPLLGVVGDAALGPQLAGPLAGTPFLAVKHSTTRRDTTPAHADPAASAAAIRAFAATCARRWREQAPASLPARVGLEIAMAPELAATVAGQGGLTLTSPAVLRAEGGWGELAAARMAAMGAAARSYRAQLEGLDLGSEAAVEAWPPARRAALQHLGEAFADLAIPAWWTE